MRSRKRWISSGATERLGSLRQSYRNSSTGPPTSIATKPDENVRNVTKMYPIVELTVYDHRRAGQLHAEADRHSSGDDAGIDDIDPMVAAVAQRFDEPVLTENVDDFKSLGVTIESF